VAGSQGERKDFLWKCRAWTCRAIRRTNRSGLMLYAEQMQALRKARTLSSTSIFDRVIQHHGGGGGGRGVDEVKDLVRHGGRWQDADGSTSRQNGTIRNEPRSRYGNVCWTRISEENTMNQVSSGCFSVLWRWLRCFRFGCKRIRAQALQRLRLRRGRCRGFEHARRSQAGAT